MTLDELEDSLPNGLHDAKLAVVTIDFPAREARLALEIWVGDDADMEAYRAAEIVLFGLIYWVSSRLTQPIFSTREIRREFPADR